MRLRAIVLTVLFTMVVSGLFIYAYFEPQTRVGQLYLNQIYSPKIDRLENISLHLKKVDGGYIPKEFDRFLFLELRTNVHDENSVKNILSFYAYQALNSRAGSIMYTDEGKPYIDALLKLGLEEKDILLQQGYVALVSGMLLGKSLYKPIVREKNLQECLEKLQNRTQDEECARDLL